MSKEKFYITTAIAYTSKKPHIGNTYEIVLTDAIARFNRFIGKDVFFLTGTDEHGQKIQEIAENEGITPKQHVDKIAGQIKDIADNKPGFIRAMWCGDRECEDKLKEVAGITSRCIPFEQELIGDTCACCGKKANKLLYWGKAY